MKNSKIYPWVVVGLLGGVALLHGPSDAQYHEGCYADGHPGVAVGYQLWSTYGCIPLDIRLDEPSVGHHCRPLEPQVAYRRQPLGMVVGNIPYGFGNHIRPGVLAPLAYGH